MSHSYQKDRNKISKCECNMLQQDRINVRTTESGVQRTRKSGGRHLVSSRLDQSSLPYSAQVCLGCPRSPGKLKGTTQLTCLAPSNKRGLFQKRILWSSTTVSINSLHNHQVDQLLLFSSFFAFHTSEILYFNLQ